MGVFIFWPELPLPVVRTCVDVQHLSRDMTSFGQVNERVDNAGNIGFPAHRPKRLWRTRAKRARCQACPPKAQGVSPCLVARIRALCALQKLFGIVRVHRRIDDSRSDGVEPYAFLRVLHGEATSDRLESAFGDHASEALMPAIGCSMIEATSWELFRVSAGQ